MSSVLITFLGFVRKDDGGKYQRTQYRIADNQVVEAEFVGLALSRNLAVDRVVMLGTAGSMWDVLVEHIADGDGEADLRIELMVAVKDGRVTQELLDRLRPFAKKSLGKEVELALIPYGESSVEQRRIVEVIATRIQPDDVVSIDVTHGLRSLAAIGLLGALYLRAVKHSHVQAVFYAAFERRESGIAPIWRLDGLLEVVDWVEAVSAFQAEPDYNVFVPLLKREEAPPVVVDALSQAAFFERTMRIGEARNKLKY